MSEAERACALCMSGGNALGAWQAGLAGALLQDGLRFPVIAGTSIGALAGALIAGNPQEEAAGALRAFWQAARQERPVWPFVSARRATLMRTLIHGHPRLFRPRVPGVLSALAGVRVGPWLYERAELRDLILQLVDFGRLEGGETRLLLATMDCESGAVVTFDSHKDRIGPDHLMAATAFPLIFEPVRVGGQLLCDAGPRQNLPLDALIGRTAGLPVLALDLFPLDGALPQDLGGMAARLQDMVLGGQSADAIARFRQAEPEATLIHALHDDPQDMTAGKTLDYDPAVLTRREARGALDGQALLAAWPGIVAGTGGTFRLRAGRITDATAAAADPGTA